MKIQDVEIELMLSKMDLTPYPYNTTLHIKVPEVKLCLRLSSLQYLKLS
jgi:hypothetical protein